MINRGKRSVVGVMVDVVDYDSAISRICVAASESRSFLVSALAVHGVMTGVESGNHKYRLNSFDLILPDGQPVRWALNLLHQGKLSERVYGPELTLRTLEAAAALKLPVYFYGTTSEMLRDLADKLRNLFPALIIAGAEPSKFRTLEKEEREDVAARVRASGAKILFVGLGCPRQEIFAYEMRELIPMPMIAVGAAFAFIAGQLPQAPPFLQKNGLEWLFRLKEEPKRLWRRYLYLNPHYLFLLARQYCGRPFPTGGTRPTAVIGPG
jgi:N-acetylglucosaminyldiphosphoundecaprenol N-acetyl-beta-D-mannosaminyltransferase